MRYLSDEDRRFDGIGSFFVLFFVSFEFSVFVVWTGRDTRDRVKEPHSNLSIPSTGSRERKSKGRSLLSAILALTVAFILLPSGKHLTQQQKVVESL